MESQQIESLESVKTSNSKNKISEILNQLEDGVKSVFSSANYINYLKTMSKFHSYSLNNTLWLFMQNPSATHIAGYTTWKSLKRHVVKGAKAMSVIAPCPIKIKIEKDTGKGEKEETEYIKKAFKVVPVFDISQTEGEPLPKLIYELDGNVENYNKMMYALKQLSPYPIEFEEIKTKAKGYCHFGDKRIAIKTGMSQLQTIKTALHETAHAVLHDVDINSGRINKEDKELRNKDNNTIEIEAESVAFVVCSHFGLDANEYSFPYLASWSTGRDVPELKVSLDIIRQTSTLFISTIDEHLQPQLQQQIRPTVKPLTAESFKNQIYSLSEKIVAAKINNKMGEASYRVAIKRMQRIASTLPPKSRLGIKLKVVASSPTLEMLQKRLSKFANDIKNDMYDLSEFSKTKEQKENKPTLQHSPKIQEGLSP